MLHGILFLLRKTTGLWAGFITAMSWAQLESIIAMLRGGMSVGAAIARLLWDMSGMELRTSLLKAGVPAPPCSESLGGCCRATPSPGTGGLGQMKLGKPVGFPTSAAGHRSGGRKCV